MALAGIESAAANRNYLLMVTSYRLCRVKLNLKLKKKKKKKMKKMMMIKIKKMIRNCGEAYWEYDDLVAKNW